MIKYLFAFLLILSWPSHAAPLVADLSSYRIDMDAGFSGTRLFLFGARNEVGDVVVVVRGPSRHYILRKKERIGGMWINNGRMKFFDMPAFYAMASSKPLPDIVRGPLPQALGLGQWNLFSRTANVLQSESVRDYAQAFVDHQHKYKYYAETPGEITFLGETLFKTAIDFPGNLPPGQYTAEIYLLSNGQIVGQQTLPLDVNKIGVDAWLYGFAHSSPALYGLAAVLVAISAGWFAGRIFEKI